MIPKIKTDLKAWEYIDLARWHDAKADLAKKQGEWRDMDRHYEISEVLYGYADSSEH